MKSSRSGDGAAPKKARWTRAQKLEAQRAKVRKQTKPSRTTSAGSDRRRDDRRDERPRSDGRWEDRGGRNDRRDERPRTDRRWESRDDRRNERPRTDRRWEDRGGRNDRRDERPRTDGRWEDRGGRNDRRDERPRTDRRWESRDDRRNERPRTDRRWEDRGGRNDRRDDRPRTDRRRNDQPRSERSTPDRRDAATTPTSAPATKPTVTDPTTEHMTTTPQTTEPATVQSPAPESTTTEVSTTFADLGLPDVIVERLARDGITTPFPIQVATIPDALAGRDVLGRGRTGSGKTLSFGLPALTKLAAGGKARPHQPRAIVLCPTRELAMQVSDALMPLVHVVGLHHKLVAGGMPYEPQLQALSRGVDLLVATPGRLIDLMERGAADLSRVEIAILDEADHMAEMGFLEAITEVLDAIPEGGQRLLFSATLDRGIDTVVDRYLVDPVTHSTDDGTASISTMQHHALLIDPQHKKVVTAEVVNREGRTVVFCRTKLGADRVASELREQGVIAAALHGGLNQSQRNRVLSAFKDGKVPVLVATDVAARGIHVDDVGVVLQIDPPADHKDYLHRAGRTARAGESGVVVTLALPHQRRTVQRLLDEAGTGATLRKARPGDDVIAAAGGSTPTAGAISDHDLEQLINPRRGRGGGHRGGPRGGGYRGGGQRGGGGHRGNRQGGRPAGPRDGSGERRGGQGPRRPRQDRY